MSDELVFNDAQTEDVPITTGEPWTVLVVDDEPDVHKVTEIVLRNFTFESRPLHILKALRGE